MNNSPKLFPKSVIDHLKELHALTANENGSQRVAWTENWQKSRDWLQEKLEQLPVEIEVDEAGNTWATLRGKSPQALIIGSHIDSVPDGGWLDGCLGVMAGLEILRRIASEGTPPVTVRLVSWADEEGTFSFSLLGSAAATGFFDPEKLRDYTDKDGKKMPDGLAQYGVDLYRAGDSSKQLENATTYLELHIEQGPVLESMNLPLGVVLGTLGVERHSIRFTGQAAHAGSTPMEMRRDALAPAAKLELEIREIARRNHGVCTMGGVFTHPGIVTAVVGQCDALLDQRSLDPTALGLMLQEAQEASRRFASEEKVEVEWKTLFAIEPIYFHPELTGLCEEAVRETCGTAHRLPSGPLHDAAFIARSGVPTAMIFVQSLLGLSHTKVEDTREEHLILSIQALDRLVSKTMNWILNR
jgi:hydantoinase/carbamoylase family amidase